MVDMKKEIADGLIDRILKDPQCQMVIADGTILQLIQIPQHLRSEVKLSQESLGYLHLDCTLKSTSAVDRYQLLFATYQDPDFHSETFLARHHKNIPGSTVRDAVKSKVCLLYTPSCLGDRNV